MDRNGQLCDVLGVSDPVSDVVNDMKFDRHLLRLSRKVDLGIPIHEDDLVYQVKPAAESDIRWLPGDSALKFVQDRKEEDDECE